ncbi:MAG: tRNA (adenine-N1)-methyltransferase [Candidatus Bathyarchaeota archaeon]|nr:tRNA (adenine-N1)-methyltransferase [Candidatus Bathyarchaeota archaeon]MDH5532460.1 tRNA (adenine-N1)-methyltransferase [Candidatus Bathyarchaeota archaeon]MDH5712926.1 tRNA (adenine-N1)-methyltransferase [Candidatus Bathyarchaeota archaeon]
MLSQTISEGDSVLLYLDRKRTYLVKVEKGKSFHTHKGFIQLDELIGKEYGTRTASSMGVEFVALKPTLRDHVFKMLRRTQITYPKDIALIVMFSGVGPGSRVVEAGTGTGALTSALAFYVKPTGHVYSYEFRKEFIETALKNLERAGASEYVDVKNKDVTQEIDEEDVDAVVLDMATPWLVVPHACKALKGSGAFVSFSPTIDQVVKTVEALKESGFVDVQTIECIMRRMQTERGKTRPETLMTGHTGYITFARKALGE